MVRFKRGRFRQNAQIRKLRIFEHIERDPERWKTKSLGSLKKPGRSKIRRNLQGY